MTRITGAVILMYLIGLYCNKIFEIFTSADEAYNVNSMFILHSPFPAVPFLTYPVIAGCAVVLDFLLFSVCELIAYPKAQRWYNRLKAARKN